MPCCFQGKKDKYIATLQITLKSGTLKDVAVCFKNDPIVHLMLDKKNKKSGEAILKGKKPIWGQKNIFDFKIKRNQREITVLCIHQISFFPNKNIGIGYIDITKYIQKGGQYINQTVNLLSSKSHDRGTLVFDIASTIHIPQSQQIKQLQSLQTVQNPQNNSLPSLINQNELQQIPTENNENCVRIKTFQSNQKNNYQPYKSQNSQAESQLKYMQHDRQQNEQIRRKSTMSTQMNQIQSQDNNIQQYQSQQNNGNDIPNKQNDISNIIDDAELARQLDQQYRQQTQQQNHPAEYNAVSVYRQIDDHAKNPLSDVFPNDNKGYDYPNE